MNQRATRSGLWLCLVLAPAGAAAAGEAGPPAEKIGIAVTEFVSKGGIEQERMDALSDMLANQIREMGPFRVIGKDDISAALRLEEQKTLLGCSDDSCLAELGGALGVRYLVVGNISLFGKTWLLNLKLLDTRRVEVVKGVSRSITGAEDLFIQGLQEAGQELISAIEGVEVRRVDAVREVGGEPGRTESGWLVPPGNRKGAFHLGLGLGGMLAPPFLLFDPQGHFDSLDDEIWGGGWLNLFLGYNASSWLTVALRVGGIVGGSGGRKRNAFEAALELQGSMLTDSWFQPHAYFDAGFAFMRDESDEPETARGQRIETFGLVLDLGIGFCAFVTPRWFVGGRLGGMLHADFALFDRVAASGDEEKGPLQRISGARALALGVTLAVVTGYEF